MLNTIIKRVVQVTVLCGLLIVSGCVVTRMPGREVVRCHRWYAHGRWHRRCVHSHRHRRRWHRH